MSNNESSGEIPVIILAAGSSSRMGRSKQLLLIHGEPLLRKTVLEAIKANTGQALVVLGANEDAHRKILKDLPVQVISNSTWKKGMGSSIKVGVKYVAEKLPKVKALILSVCDQPHLSSSHFQTLVNKYLSDGNKIVASRYQDTLGVPILFDQTHFKDLLRISDAGGAKSIAEKNRNDVFEISFPEGTIDLDTMEDYNTFIR